MSPCMCICVYVYNRYLGFIFMFMHNYKLQLGVRDIVFHKYKVQRHENILLSTLEALMATLWSAIFNLCG